MSVTEALRREQETVRHGVWNLSGVFTAGDLSDDGLERVRRSLSRRIEDATDGLLSPRESTSQVVQRARRELKEIESEQALRSDLRYCGAREDGTHSLAEYQAAGGMKLHIAEDGEQKIVCDKPPSYRLAMLLDYRRFRDGGAHVIDWPHVETSLGGRDAVTSILADSYLKGVA